MADNPNLLISLAEPDPATEVDLYTQGKAQLKAGKVDQAVHCLQAAWEADPKSTRVMRQLLKALMKQGEVVRAREVYEAWRRTDEEVVRVAAYWINRLKWHWHLGLAVEEAQKAIAEYGSQRALEHALAFALAAHARVDEALAQLDASRRAGRADLQTRKIFLYLLYYSDAFPAAAVDEELNAFRDIVAEQYSHVLPQSFNGGVDKRPLRVGYLSTELRTHSILYFVLPLFRAHDRDRVRVFAYADIDHPDTGSEAIGQAVDEWVSINGMTQDAVAERIQADGIDILVDLNWFIAGGRWLSLMAAKPAPVLIEWLQADSSALATFDYYLTDEIIDRPRTLKTKAFRLPGGCHCYQPPDNLPAVRPRPSVQGGPIRFASFNNLAKLSPRTIALWARILHAVSDSCLLLKTYQLADPAVRQWVQELFEERGIAAKRLSLLPASPVALHLLAYTQVDIALDTVPYNGVTTTCEALWMGTPAVVLQGETSPGRKGASLLHSAGLPELVAYSEDEYVTIACELAMDRARLYRYHDGLRECVSSSPLADAQGFARKMEAMFSEVWSERCAAANQ